MVYLKSFYGLVEKLKLHSILGKILVILSLGLWAAQEIIDLPVLDLIILGLFTPGLLIWIVQGSKYSVTRDSLAVLRRDFPPGFDTNDVYLDLEWVWPTIEIHLHRDHLFVIQRDHFLAEDLNEISWIFTTPGGNRYYYLLFLEIILKDGRHRTIWLPHSGDMDWSGIGRTSQDTEDLYRYLREHYPHIMTGYSKARKQAWLKQLPWHRRILGTLSVTGEEEVTVGKQTAGYHNGVGKI